MTLRRSFEWKCLELIGAFAMRKYVSRFPKERPGEALIDWEERELMKKAKKFGVRTRPMRKKGRRP